jgi:hypothetical protein
VRDVALHVVARDDVQEFIHVKQDPRSIVAVLRVVVVLVTTNKMLDLAEGLFDRIEVRRVWRKVFDADAKAIC